MLHFALVQGCKLLIMLSELMMMMMTTTVMIESTQSHRLSRI